MRRTTFFLTLLVGFAILITGCPGDSGGNGSSSGKVRIAVAGPMSGSAAAFGEMISKAAKLKVKEVNEAGGINGKMVELVIEDDRGDTGEAANVSRKLAGDKSISIVVGHFNSTCSNAAKEEYNRKGVVEFSPASTNVAVCVGSPWTFRNLYRDDYQGTFLANYAKTQLGAKSVAIYYDNDDYGKGLRNAFSKAAKDLGLKIVVDTSYIRERTQDFKPLASQIKGKRVDAVFISGLYNEAALLSKAIKGDLGMDLPILAGDGVMNQKYIELAGKAAEGAFVTTPFLFEAVKNDPKAKTFQKSFMNTHKIPPDTWAALTYDAMGMAIEAITEVGTDRKAIKDWFASITDESKAYIGVTGPTYFDSEGDCYSKGAHVAVVKNGQFVAAKKQLTLKP